MVPATRKGGLGRLFAFLLACLLAAGGAARAGEGRRVMVAAANPLAVEAGLSVLQQGGNAVDAAIAIQLVLGLVEPESSGIGGGAFLLHWSASQKRLRTYDGRETAPAAARPDRFLDASGKPLPFDEAAVSGRSVGVPGVLRMLELAHQRHGRLPWAELFRVAIFLAEEGFPVSRRLNAMLGWDRHLRNDPAARALYYDAGGAPKPMGSRVVNREYGATLRTLASEGAQAFYRGPIATDLVRAVRGHARPGDLTEEDLAGYRAVEREPVCGPFRAFRVCSMAPPSSGGIAVLQILGILERAGFERAAPHSERALHLFSEAARLAYADRARHLGDPDFVRVPVAELLAPRYLDERARRVGERSMGLAPPGDPEGGTSHFVVVDAAGDAVSMTTTIEWLFGSRIMVRGFLLNNQLTDFDFVPGGANQVQAGKRPRSSMAPAMVLDRDGRLQLAIGSPGGSFIISYVARALVARLDWGLGLQEALDAPNVAGRIAATEIERGTAYEALATALRERGHEVVLRDMTSGLHALERTERGWRGAADRRRDGIARGD